LIVIEGDFMDYFTWNDIKPLRWAEGNLNYWCITSITIS